MSLAPLTGAQLPFELFASQRSGAARCTDAAWAIWIATLPLGHLTGWHNTWSVLVIGASVWQAGIDELDQIPALPWLVALCALATASLSWSAQPQTSGAKLRSDLVMPILGYISAFLWARQGGAKAIFYGYLAGIALLALFSLPALLPPQASAGWPLVDELSDTGRLMPHWYPGVGDASSAAVLALAVLLTYRGLVGHWRDLQTAWMALGILLIVWVSRNRSAVGLLPVSVASFLWLVSAHQRATRQGAQRSARAALKWGLMAMIALALSAVIIERASQERLAKARQAVPFGRAAVTLAALDPRPRMWSEFMRLGAGHAWFGIGYGRTVPALAYDVRDDPVMQAAHASGYEHGHNVFLNLWLQLGFAGLALFFASLFSFIKCAWKRTTSSKGSWLVGVGALVLLQSTLLRNLTDDFLVYGMASAFWIGLGALFGLGARDDLFTLGTATPAALPLDEAV